MCAGLGHDRLEMLPRLPLSDGAQSTQVPLFTWLYQRARGERALTLLRVAPLCGRANEVAVPRNPTP